MILPVYLKHSTYWGFIQFITNTLDFLQKKKLKILHYSSRLLAGEWVHVYHINYTTDKRWACSPARSSCSDRFQIDSEFNAQRFVTLVPFAPLLPPAISHTHSVVSNRWMAICGGNCCDGTRKIAKRDQNVFSIMAAEKLQQVCKNCFVTAAQHCLAGAVNPPMVWDLFDWVSRLLKDFT